MARIEKITITCDGPCGGNPIEGDAVTLRIQPDGRQPKAVDLCGQCGPSLLEIYERGTTPTAATRGRPRKATAVKATAVPVVSPAGEVDVVPVGQGAPHVQPEPVAVVEVPEAERPYATGMVVGGQGETLTSWNSNDPNL